MSTSTKDTPLGVRLAEPVEVSRIQGFTLIHDGIKIIYEPDIFLIRQVFENHSQQYYQFQKSKYCLFAKVIF